MTRQSPLLPTKTATVSSRCSRDRGAGACIEGGSRCSGRFGEHAAAGGGAQFEETVSVRHRCSLRHRGRRHPAAASAPRRRPARPPGLDPVRRRLQRPAGLRPLPGPFVGPSGTDQEACRHHADQAGHRDAVLPSRETRAVPRRGTMEVRTPRARTAVGAPGVDRRLRCAAPWLFLPAILRRRGIRNQHFPDIPFVLLPGLHVSTLKVPERVRGARTDNDREHHDTEAEKHGAEQSSAVRLGCRGFSSKVNLTRYSQSSTSHIPMTTCPPKYATPRNIIRAAT